MIMFKRFCILMIVFGLLLAKQAYPSDRIDYSDETIPIRLKIGIITETEFPKPIANVTKSVDSRSLQIETLGNRMFLLPRDNFDCRVYVVTEDNISYCLHLMIDEAQADTRIKIEKPVKKKASPQTKEALNTIELMKALINGELPKDSLNLRLNNQEIFNNGKFRITADEIYEIRNGTRAFVLTFENLGRKPVVVPVEHIEVPGLLAISIDSQILEARPHDVNKGPSGYMTKAYMIVKGQGQ